MSAFSRQSSQPSQVNAAPLPSPPRPFPATHRITMPTITVNKAELYKRLGREYSTEEFDELCFQFGIELDEDTTAEVDALRQKGGVEWERIVAEGGEAAEAQLKIEIPANRYDLLCLEGLSRGLRMFLGLAQPPVYHTAPASASVVECTVEPSVNAIRPLFASAILRLKEPFTEGAYKSFIDLQDKLHMNLCRQRRLVAIGTHDLDTIQAPFRYMAKDPKEIKFAPLNKDQEYTAEELMSLYETDRHLAKYLPIIRDSPVYPIIYDANDRVLSMPPIINSQRSKITMQTRNIFIDVTATDQTKIDIVVNIIVAMYSEYCQVPFEVEPVKINYPDGTSRLSPDMTPRSTTASVSYINAALGLSLSPNEICTYLKRMSLLAVPSPSAPEEVLDVQVPSTRPDILHECDIMEDVGIAYGFNNLPKGLPNTNTVAKPLPINKLGDILRRECASAGWVEVLPLILCSHDENFAHLNRKDGAPGAGAAIKLLNPATQEFQIVRTSLIPGLLKTLRENKALPLPLRIFECSDIAVQDAREERMSRNERHLSAAYMDKRGGFEVVHGLLDRLMHILEVPFIGALTPEERDKAEHGYYIRETQDEMYFPGRAATIYYRARATSTTTESSALETVAKALKDALPGTTTSAMPSSKQQDLAIGSLGILHPSVLVNFSLVNPCSVLEINVEPFL